MLKIRKFLKPIVRSEIVTASCSRQHHTKELKLVEYGNVETSLKLETNEELHNSENNLKPGEVLVKLKASPINPADLNIIQGKYGILPESLPANLGNEGLFEVVKSNGANNRLRTGDLVLPVWKTGWGTWRSHAVANESIFYKVSLTDQQIPGLYQALATLTVNPPTAYRMLTNFVDLKPGDTVIQNGANSAVGQAAIQFAKIFKINLVNIVRKREKQDALNAYLKDLGAEYIFVEEDLRKSPLLTRELWEKIPRPRLALNCVGGKATTDMLRLMGKNATVVTYGGMSKQPVILNTADFIFKNLKACGFWLTVWKAENREEYEKTLDIIVDMIRKKEFKAPQCEEFKLDDYRDAFKRLQTPFISSKILFVN